METLRRSPELDPDDIPRVKPNSPRRYAPTAQLALECMSSFAGIRTNRYADLLNEISRTNSNDLLP